MNFTEYIWLLYFYHLYDILYSTFQLKEKKENNVCYKALRILMFIRH